MVVSSQFGALTCICPGCESLATHIARVSPDGRARFGNSTLRGLLHSVLHSWEPWVNAFDCIADLNLSVLLFFVLCRAWQRVSVERTLRWFVLVWFLESFLDCLTAWEFGISVSGMSLGPHCRGCLTLPSACTMLLCCLWDPCFAATIGHFALHQAKATGDHMVDLVCDRIAQQLGLCCTAV